MIHNHVVFHLPSQRGNTLKTSVLLASFASGDNGDGVVWNGKGGEEIEILALPPKKRFFKREPTELIV